jgi:hydroxyacylglutathione hydrolase
LGAQSLFSRETEVLFSGDTLFTMGCGRLLEGTAKQLYQSLQFIKNLPDSTQIFCGHEYTEQNIAFAVSLSKNPDVELLKYRDAVSARRRAGHPTVPSLLGHEKTMNPFLMAKNQSEFTKLRLKKDDFQLEEGTGLRY